MNVVLLLCSGGATSSLMASKIQGAGKESGLVIDFDYVRILNERDWKEKHKDVDLLILYGGVGCVNRKFIEESGEDIDALLIAPQVKYELKKVQELLNSFDNPFLLEPINGISFGRMDGKAVIEQALRLIENKKFQ